MKFPIVPKILFALLFFAPSAFALSTNSIRSEIQKFSTPLERIEFAQRSVPSGLKSELQTQLRGAGLLRMTEVALVIPPAGTNELTALTFEDAQWVYAALRHCHIPAHLLTEEQLIKSPLEQYKAIYICKNVKHETALKIKEWVCNGGTLWTDALGLSRGETNQPLSEMTEVLGVSNRTLESWARLDRHSTNEFKPFLPTGASPAAKIFTVDMGQVEFEVAMGRMPLETKTGKVLAQFGDQKAAVIQNQFGKGKVVVFGFWAGLSYSAKIRNPTFHLRDDLDPALASAISRAALNSGITQAVMPFEQLVEAVYLHQNGHRRIALVNWDYECKPGETSEHLVPAQDISIQLIHVGTIHSVRSLVHGNLKVEPTPGAESPNNKTVTLPKLDAMDLLIIE